MGNGLLIYIMAQHMAQHLVASHKHAVSPLILHYYQDRRNILQHMMCMKTQSFAGNINGPYSLLFSMIILNFAKLASSLGSASTHDYLSSRIGI